MSEGVEWAVRSCVLLAWLGGDQPVSTAKLAAAHDLPPAYLNKHLQALRRAGIVTSTAGARGGFRLARATDQITLLEIVTAVDGAEDAFQCQEIRREGLGADAPAREFRNRCAIATAMRRADLVWRRALAAQSLADVLRAAERSAPGARRRARAWQAGSRASNDSRHTRD